MVTGRWYSSRALVTCLKAVLRLVPDVTSVPGYNARGTLVSLELYGIAALPQTQSIDAFVCSLLNRVGLAGVDEAAIVAVALPLRWKDARQGRRLPRQVKHAFEACLLAGESEAAYKLVANATAMIDSLHAPEPASAPTPRVPTGRPARSRRRGPVR